MASLTIIVDGTEQRYPLDSAAVTLGRGLESDIRLKDIKASRRHCQIVKTTRGYQCVDLSSGNGTYVNGVQIKTQMLDGGDKITIGSTTISFEDAAKGPPPAKPSCLRKCWRHPGGFTKPQGLAVRTRLSPCQTILNSITMTMPSS